MGTYEFRVVDPNRERFIEELNQLGSEGFHVVGSALTRSTSYPNGVIMLERET